VIQRHVDALEQPCMLQHMCCSSFMLLRMSSYAPHGWLLCFKLLHAAVIFLECNGWPCAAGLPPSR